MFYTNITTNNNKNKCVRTARLAL